ncbi:MAG: AMP-dependent synthetase and ligase [Marmoricola sp.]|nr:AMP-dependent synthetase and ligase [Marmoricola sp.]
MGSTTRHARLPVSVARVSSLHPVSGTAEEVLGLLREWDAADDPEPLVISTSGSTGRPKRVMLSRDAMRASALATHERLGGPGQWVLNLPPTHIAGVQLLYRSVVAGTEPLTTQDIVHAHEHLTSDRSYVSLVPTQLHRLLDVPPAVKALAAFDAVLIGGAAFERGLRTRAESEGIRVIATYGMSETCGGCVYDGLPLDGVEIRIDDGRVLLRGPMLFEGYQGDPELTAQALQGGWLVTHDLGRFAADGRLRLTGRDDDMIMTGGVKVPAPAVVARVREHPSVFTAEVLGVPDEQWGERVVAFVVGPVELDALRDWVSAECPRAWAPHQLVRLGEMPLLPNGKVDRLRLRGLA